VKSGGGVPRCLICGVRSRRARPQPPGGFVRVCTMNALSPETLQLLQTVLDETWESLRPEEKSRTTKAEIGRRLLERAKAGERDAFRLRLAAVSGIVTFAL
jgi:hypothetical protein